MVTVAFHKGELQAFEGYFFDKFDSIRDEQESLAAEHIRIEHILAENNSSEHPKFSPDLDAKDTVIKDLREQNATIDVFTEKLQKLKDDVLKLHNAALASKRDKMHI
eukprot:Colp12_sorted_trinity150504_noHs@3656